MSLHAEKIQFTYGPRFSLLVEEIGVGRGEFVAIIGANGSGKTTLMRILAALLRPDSGRIILDGEPLEEFSPNRRARHLAYVPQSYRPAFEFTVEQTVLLGRLPYRSSYGGFEREEDLAAASGAITLMELEKLRGESITNLSGGEIQRVMIAKAIAQGGAEGGGTLLLDEPNSHLDITHQQSVLATVRGLVEENGLGVIASIHDLNLASIFSDRIVAIADGEVIASGTPVEVLTRDVLMKTFGADLEVNDRAYGAAPSVSYRYVERRSYHG